MGRTNASGQRTRDYSDVPLPSVGRSAFTRNHSRTTAFNAGDLVVTDREEVYPGDTFTIQPTVFARITTMEVVPFSNVWVDTHYFFVPTRLIWENSEEFFGAEPGGPGTRVDRLTPKLDISSSGVPEDSLHDHIGITPGVVATDATNQPHNLYGRAYNLIWNEWYRDAELQALLPVDTDDGPDSISDYTIQKRNKQRDRFTSARPWPQKGPDVTIPLGTTAPVLSSGGISLNDGSGERLMQSFGTQGFQAQSAWPGTAPQTLNFTASSNVYADLSSAAAATVQELRVALATQHLFEMFSRAGSARYAELLHTAFGVSSPDMRLQRPEFLGGASARLYVNPVAVTVTAGQSVGDLGSFGVAAGSGRPFSYSSTEHGYILGITSIRSEYLYSEGIDKDLMRHDRFDFFWPQFQNIGEQPILARELFYSGTTATDQTVFGYEPRYQELRERMSSATGPMRVGHSATLSNWHLGQEFGSAPLLNSAFIEENPPMDRITTVASSVAPTFKVDTFVRTRAVRPVSAMGTPGLTRF